MNTNWEFYKFSVYDNYAGMQNVVYGYHFTVTVSDGISSASTQSYVRLMFDTIENYIPFESLTHEKLVEWTLANTHPNMLTHLRSQVLATGSQTTDNLPAPWVIPPPSNPAQ